MRASSLLAALVLVAACSRHDARPMASASVAAPPDVPIERTRLTWGALRVIDAQSVGSHALQIRDGEGRRLLALPEAEHVDVCELVELDGHAPAELWVATSSGAHGNRQDWFFGQQAGRPVELLGVGTDEGSLEVKDIDGDSRPEIVGEVSSWFDGDAWDFDRPLVLAWRAGRWRDVTASVPGLLHERVEAEERAALASSDCTPGNALNVYGLSVMAGEAAAADRWLGAHCSDAQGWLAANRAGVERHVRTPVFQAP